MRRNGFQWPLDPQQVSSWVLFVAFVALTAAAVVPILPSRGAWAFAAVYASLALATLLVAAHTTASNAIDECVLGTLEPNTFTLATPAGAGREARPSRRIFSLWIDATVKPWAAAPTPVPSAPTPDQPSSEELSYCYLCQVGVKRRSKHCKTCRKCVDQFDHHCVWLNNCVGVRNYPAFIVTISVACALLTAQLGGALAALGIAASNDRVSGWPAALARLERRLGPAAVGSRTAHVSLIAVLVLLSVPTWLLVAQLCAFHAHLRKEGLTTYDYVLREQMRSNERGAAAEPRQPLRRLRAVLCGKRHARGSGALPNARGSGANAGAGGSGTSGAPGGGGRSGVPAGSARADVEFAGVGSSSTRGASTADGDADAGKGGAADMSAVARPATPAAGGVPRAARGDSPAGACGGDGGRGAQPPPIPTSA